jgi:hypothetical protein
MSYSRDWSESTPPGTAPANTLDTIIQHVKTDVRERIASVIPGWTDDAESPKRVVVYSGILGDRPSGGDAHTGELFFATDTGELYVYDGSGWVLITAGTGGGGNGATGPASVGTVLFYHTHDYGSGTGEQVLEERIIGGIPASAQVLSVRARCRFVGDGWEPRYSYSARKVGPLHSDILIGVESTYSLADISVGFANVAVVVGYRVQKQTSADTEIEIELRAAYASV